MGGAVVTITTTEVVRTLKERLQSTVEAIDAQVQACTTLDKPTVAAWNAFESAWHGYYQGRDDWHLGFGTAAIYDQGLEFERQIRAWQDFLDTKCSVNAPGLVPTDEPSAAGSAAMQVFLGVGLGAAGAVAAFYAWKYRAEIVKVVF